MKRRLAFLLPLLLCAHTAYGAITPVSKCGDPSSSPSNPCSSGISTTGATLLVAINGTNSSTCPTDSQGNTWTNQMNISGGGFGGTYTLCYVNNPSTSGSHTFTCGGTLCGVVVGAYSGTNTSGPLDTTCTGSTNWGCASSLTPANNGSLFFAGTGGPISAAGTLAISAGLTLQEYVQGTGGVSYGADFADLVQGTAGALTPQFSDSNVDAGVMLLAIFKPAAGGGGCSVAPSGLTLLGVGNCKGEH